MTALTKIDPEFVRQNGTRLENLQLPQIKPAIASNFLLLAVIITKAGQETLDVTMNSAYAEMYDNATMVGCPYSVHLYTLHEDYLVW